MFNLPGAAELVEDVLDHVEDDDPHDLALDHNGAAAVVGSDAPWEREDVRTELQNLRMN